MLEPELLWEVLPSLPQFGEWWLEDPRRNIESQVWSILDRIPPTLDSVLYNKVLPNYPSAAKSVPASSDETAWQTNLPTLRLRSKIFLPIFLDIVYSDKREGKYFLLTFHAFIRQKYLKCLTSHWMLFSLILRRFCKERQSAANLSDSTKQLTHQPAWR